MRGKLIIKLPDTDIHRILLDKFPFFLVGKYVLSVKRDVVIAGKFE